MQRRNKEWIVLLIACAFLLFPGVGPLAKMVSKIHRVTASVLPANLYPLVLPALENGVPWDMTLGSMQFANVTIDVPTDAVSLTVTLTQGAGDLDLYLKFGSKVSGNKISELDNDADIRSDGPTAAETIEITPTTTPALKQGTWYIAALNLNSYTTSFQITANYQTTFSRLLEEDHEITTLVAPGEVTPGNLFTWKYEIAPGTAGGDADVVAAVMVPGGPLLFFNPEGITEDPEVFRWGIEVDEDAGEAVIRDFPFPSGLPEGEYQFYNLLVREGNPIFDDRNWVSNVGVGTLRYGKLSSCQKALVDAGGHPVGFVKSFCEPYGSLRVDETWVHQAQGTTTSFTNAGYTGEQATSGPQALVARATPWHAEDYTFDTTPQAVISKHGAPVEVLEKSVWNGTFKNYVYDDMVLGFCSDRLVSVLAPPGATEASGKAVQRHDAQQPGDRPERLPAAEEEVSTGWLFTLASALGAAASADLPGARNSFDVCMAGIKTGEPTQQDIDCFQNALGAVAAQQNGTIGPAGILEGLGGLWSSLWGHQQTSSRAVSPLSQGKTGCYLTVTPQQARPGDTVVIRLQVISVRRDGVANVDWWSHSGSELGGPMSRVDAGTWQAQYTVPLDQETDMPINVPVSTGGEDRLCFPHTRVSLVDVPLSVGIEPSPDTLRAPANVSVYAWARSGLPPYTFQWSVDGEASTIISDYSSTVTKRFEKPGSYAVSVSVTDKLNNTGSGAASILVLPMKLRVEFGTQTSLLEVNEWGHWSVSAWGGTPPWNYSWSFESGPSSSNYAASCHWGEPWRLFRDCHGDGLGRSPAERNRKYLRLRAAEMCSAQQAVQPELHPGWRRLL